MQSMVQIRQIFDGQTPKIKKMRLETWVNSEAVAPLETVTVSSYCKNSEKMNKTRLEKGVNSESVATLETVTVSSYGTNMSPIHI